MFRAIFLLALMPALAMATAGFSLQDGTSSCSGGFTLDSLDFSCDDDGACTMGETMGVAGSISASSDLPSTATVDVKGCVFTYVCYSWSFSSVDLCNKMGLQSSDGSSTCPSAGSYDFSSSFATPGDGSWEIPSWLEGYTVTVTATITDEESSSTSTTCTVKVATTSSSSTTEYTMAASIAALAMLGTAFWARRRKTHTSARIHLLELENADEDEVELAARRSALV